MIMDEVLAVGDAKFQEKCLGRMGAEAHGGRTVLYVSHNMNTIRQLCNRVIVLNQGKLIFDGDVETGISIYNNHSALKTSRHLTDLERESQFSLHPVTMQYIELYTDKNGKIPFGSTLKGKLRLISGRDYSDLHLSIIVKHISQIPITRVASQSTFTLNQDQSKEIEFQMDISHIVPGKYRLDLIVSTYNSFHSAQYLDVLREVVSFEIENTAAFSNSHTAGWHTQYSGFYVSSPLAIIE